MKLKDILIREGMYTTTQYWILPSGKVKRMKSGHVEYLADEGMSYGKAFTTGYIRLAIADNDETLSAEWSKEATRPAKKALGNIVKRAEKAGASGAMLYYDIVKIKNPGDMENMSYIKSGNTDYKGFLRLP
jgi:hypothetical protein